MKKVLTVLFLVDATFPLMAALTVAAECGLITMTSLPDGSEVSEYVQVDLPLLGAESVQLTLDGEVLFSSEENLKTVWKPRALGEHTLVYTAGEKTITRTVKVVDLDVSPRRSRRSSQIQASSFRVRTNTMKRRFPSFLPAISLRP